MSIKHKSNHPHVMYFMKQVMGDKRFSETVEFHPFIENAMRVYAAYFVDEILDFLEDKLEDEHDHYKIKCVYEMIADKTIVRDALKFDYEDALLKGRPIIMNWNAVPADPNVEGTIKLDPENDAD